MSIIDELNNCIKPVVQNEGSWAGEDRDLDGLPEQVTETGFTMSCYGSTLKRSTSSVVTYSWGEVDGKSAWVSKTGDTITTGDEVSIFNPMLPDDQPLRGTVVAFYDASVGQTPDIFNVMLEVTLENGGIVTRNVDDMILIGR